MPSTSSISIAYSKLIHRIKLSFESESLKSHNPDSWKSSEKLKLNLTKEEIRHGSERQVYQYPINKKKDLTFVEKVFYLQALLHALIS